MAENDAAPPHKNRRRRDAWWKKWERRAALRADDREALAAARDEYPWTEYRAALAALPDDEIRRLTLGEWTITEPDHADD